jgi:hypothetical protein
MTTPAPHPDTLTRVELIWREKQIEQWFASAMMSPRRSSTAAGAY